MRAGFFDLQVNGYAGVDFNSDRLSAVDLHRACARMATHGVQGFLATVVTDHLEHMAGRLRRLVRLREADPLARRLIAGWHVEGPFLNPQPGYRGAHPREFIRPATWDAMQRLLEAGGGLVRLVTLAPECDAGYRVIRRLATAGITVAAGHTDATREQLTAAVDAGLTLFTHLGNGCPLTLPRHDNIIQRALSLRARLRFTFIADGVHVPFFALANYLRAAGIERCAVVTDAMAAAGLGPGCYRLGRWRVRVGHDLAAWAPDRSHLVGSAATMQRVWRNLRGPLGLTLQAARWLTRTGPREAVPGAFT